MKDLFLLIQRLTYFPLSAKLRRGENRLPKALRFLPLLGLFCGVIMYGAARLFVVLPDIAAAAALVALNLFLGGGLMLQDMMTVADGISAKPKPPANMAAEYISPDMKICEDNKLCYGKAAVVWGAVWLCALYLVYLCLYRISIYTFIPLIMAAIFSRWAMGWLVFGFMAIPPAWLQLGFSKFDFLLSTGLALLFLLPFSSLALFLSLFTSLLGIYLFAMQRQRSAGGLDEACYGAGVVWGEILFLLSWLLYGSIT